MSSCRKQLGVFTDLACVFESGGVNSWAIVTEEKAAVADADTTQWSLAAFWETETYGGDIVVFKDTSGNYEPAPITLPGKGNQVTRNAGYTHTLTIQLESVKSNNKFMNDLTVADNYRVCWCGDYKQILFVSTQNARITPRQIQPQELNSYLEWEIVCEWSDIKHPESYDVPPGVFVD